MIPKPHNLLLSHLPFRHTLLEMSEGSEFNSGGCGFRKWNIARKWRIVSPRRRFDRLEFSKAWNCNGLLLCYRLQNVDFFFTRQFV